MLVIERCIDQTLLIGDGIEVTITSVQDKGENAEDKKVGIQIKVPEGVRVQRGEDVVQSDQSEQADGEK
jgi:sRNA-binding carbon storage regulator CsrA